MSWIKTIPYEEADQNLKKIYDRINGPNKKIDNVLQIHSLRPHSLTGHMTLYKSVLHNSNNTLPKWYLECIGVYVSHLNKCSYCIEHHYAGLKRLLNDDEKATTIFEAIKKDSFEGVLEKKYLTGLDYSKMLTKNPDLITEADVIILKDLGFSEGEVLEINQVAAYFNYANRTVLGLGVNTAGDVLGLSPNNSAEPDNWNHQ